MSAFGFKMFVLWIFGFFAIMLATGLWGASIMMSCSLGMMFPSVVVLIALLVRIGEQERAADHGK